LDGQMATIEEQLGCLQRFEGEFEAFFKQGGYV
jgi:hypothetical protein